MTLEKIITGFLIGGVMSGCVNYGGFDKDRYIKEFPNISQRNKTEYPQFHIFYYGGLNTNFPQDSINCLLSEDTRTYSVINFGHWHEHMTSIRESIRSGNSPVLIGYSLGCREALRVANLLNETKVNVPLLIFLDATHTTIPILTNEETKIPPNVKTIYNLISEGPFQGRELNEADTISSNTEIFNFTSENLTHSNLPSPDFFCRFAPLINNALHPNVLNGIEVYEIKKVKN